MKTLERYFPLLAAYNHRRRWQRKWRSRQFTPNWLMTEVPGPLRQAVASGWFPPDATVLDVGCGSGESAAWLRSAGLSVVGVDLAAGAIERARAAHGEEEGRLAFAVLDICRSAPAGRFEAVFDRGCLHGLPAPLAPRYREHLAACTEPGARFLLMHRLLGCSPGVQLDALSALLAPCFRVLRSEAVEFPRFGGPPAPGLAVRLERR